MPASVAGTEILSKYPVTDEAVFKYHENLLYHCRTEIEIGDQTITVFSAHPPVPTNNYQNHAREEESSELAKSCEIEGPVLLLGDMNMTDLSLDYHKFIGAGLHDVQREIGIGFGNTWPVRIPITHPYLPTWCMIPLMRGDMIFYSDDFTPVSVRRGPFVHSDHLPVIAELVLVP
ncbi:MAG TPA: endonuclease/exonuclease/phosphatase family protein [bacterium]|jgi:endonuclease/exonuclease/phosphatase family metal-dependent hydrolase